MEPLPNQPASYDDLREYPEKVRAEVLSGVVRVQPSPLPRHQFVLGQLSVRLGGAEGPRGPDDPGGWWILSDIDTRFGPHDIVRPDMVAWRRERLPDPWTTRPIDVRPDWVCEIVSPSNAGHDRVTKADLYASHGVPHYWIIDPASRVLEAFAHHEGGWLRLGAWTSESTAAIPPFDAIDLDLGRLFPPATEPVSP